MAGYAEAYDFSLFEEKNISASSAAPKRERTPERKSQAQIIELPGVKQNPVKRKKTLKAIAKIFGFLVICALVGNLIYGMSVLTELDDEIETAQSALAEEQSIRIQLETKRAEKYTDEYVRKYAEEKLGMRELTDSQIQYFSVYTSDQGAVLQENEDGGVLLRLFNWFAKALS